MNPLLTQFKVSKDVKQLFSKADARLRTIYAPFEPGETISFPPDERFGLRSEGTLVLTFMPVWEAWADSADPQSMQSAPCLIQCGSESDPGAVFKLCVTRELDALILSSSKPHTKPLRLEGDFKEGAQVVICFNSATTIMAKYGNNGGDASSVFFALGVADGPSHLRLGSGKGAAPFAGMIGAIVLFDRDLSGSLKHNGPSADLIVAWERGDAGKFFELAGKETSDGAARALLGAAIPNEKRFDFIPRDILWPVGPLARWMLLGGDDPPEKVYVESIPDSSSHGIYSTNQVYCFPRVQGECWLWGDEQGQFFALWGAGTQLTYIWGEPKPKQRFKLKYIGNNQFTGIMELERETGNLTILLTYTEGKLGNHDEIRITPTPVGAWKNVDKRVFVTKPFPLGTELESLRELDKVPDALKDPKVRQVWPQEPILRRLAATYKLQNRVEANPTQPWEDRFSGKPPLVRFSMQGWDITKLRNPFNPIDSSAADHDALHYLFKIPEGTAYRANDNTPYYIFNKAIEGGSEDKNSYAFRSTREFAQKTSQSVGMGLSEGETSLVSVAFDSATQNGLNISVEHSVAVEYTSPLKFAALLERQFITLNPQFIADLLMAIGSHYLTKPTDPKAPLPPPDIATAMDETRFDKLYTVFGDYGTHYPNAIIYGSSVYSFALIDSASMAKISSSTKGSKLGFKIPFEGLLVGLDASKSTTTDGKVETGTQAEIYLKKTAGSTAENGEVPVKLDLRPIWELLQPPYIINSDVIGEVPYVDDIVSTLGLIKTAWSQYLVMNTQPSPDGFVLYQARLVSLRNTGSEPCYVNARAFLAGMTPNKDWEIALPEPADQRSSSLIVWAANGVRIDPGQTIDLPFDKYTSLSIPGRRSGEAEPAIGITGLCLVMHAGAIRKTLPGDDRAVSMGDTFVWQHFQATNEDVLAEEATLARSWGVDLLGCKPVTWTLDSPALYIDTHVDVNINEIWRLTELPDDGALVEKTMTFLNLKAVFEARKVDLQSCFKGKTKAATGKGA